MPVQSAECGVRNEMCAHFGVCGGCSSQNLSYEEQLLAKEKRVRDFLKDLSVQNFHAVLPSPEIYFYRNKMEFSFGDERDMQILSGSNPHPALSLKGEGGEPPGSSGEGKIHLGLHPKGRFALVTPTPGCLLLSEESQKILSIVSKWATKKGISVYVRKNGLGDLRHLVIREGKNTGERMVNLVAKSATPHVGTLAKDLQDSGVPITTFLWTAYDGLSDVAKGEDQKIFWGGGFIRENVGGVTLQVNPASFMQTNTHAAEQMLEVLKNWIKQDIPHPTLPTVKRGEEFLPMSPNGEGRVGSSLIDLYCGSGAIGLSLVDLFDEVIGVEIHKDAVSDARRNAEANHISNIRFIEGKTEEAAPQFPVREKMKDTFVVVDPPRPGLHPSVVETLVEWAVPHLFYVSCNPETLARDLQALSTRYDILDAQPMDFFPHTDHVETAVRLRSKT